MGGTSLKGVLYLVTSNFDSFFNRNDCACTVVTLAKNGD